jgi:hypothetical protein
VPGDVYNPAAEIVPTAALSDQRTDVLVLPVTVAKNCVAAPAVRLTDAGDMVTFTGATIVAEADADLVGSARLVAATATVAGVGTAAGAVYSPVLDTVPTVALPPASPFTAQETPAFVVPVTVAVSC